MLFPDIDHPWEAKSLGEIFRLSTVGINPHSYPREVFIHYSIPAWDEIGGPIVNLGKEIDSGKLLLTDSCVLVSKLNPHIPRVRSFEPPNDGRRACASTEIMPYVPLSSETSIPFYTQYFKSDRFRKNLISAASGSTNSHRRVRPPQTLTWILPFPESSEQIVIARILDAVDAAILRTRQVVDAAKEMRQAVIQRFFYEAIGETAYADRPTKKLPAGWSLIPTESLLAVDPKNGVSPKASTQPPGVPTFNIAAIRDGRVDLRTVANLKYADVPVKVAEKYRLNIGDVLIVRGNANLDLVGKAGQVTYFPEDCIYPDITKRVVFRSEGENTITPEYAVLVWNHPIVHNQILRRAKTSNGTLKINNRDVKQIIIPVPSSDEQQAIVNLVAAAEAKIDALTSKLKIYEQLKRSLMHDLLTGTVRVDPSLLSKVAAL